MSIACLSTSQNHKILMSPKVVNDEANFIFPGEIDMRNNLYDLNVVEEIIRILKGCLQDKFLDECPEIFIEDEIDLSDDRK